MKHMVGCFVQQQENHGGPSLHRQQQENHGANHGGPSLHRQQQENHGAATRETRESQVPTENAFTSFTDLLTVV